MRTIEAKVSGNRLWKDSKLAGVQGEANVTKLRITFDAEWGDMAKKITWWDAKGQNPVEVILTTNLLEDAAKSTLIYLCPIPGEPLAEAGWCTCVIDGFVDDKRQRTAQTDLEVQPAKSTDNAGQPADPTPTLAEQLQAEIDSIKDDIQKAAQAADGVEAVTALVNEAKASEEAAGRSAFNADEARKAAEAAQKAAEDAKDETANLNELAHTAADDAEQAAIEAEAQADLALEHAEDAEDSAQRAAESAAAAELSASMVDAEQINANIATKADNLYFDEVTKLLYLTSNGEIIGDGIAVSTGGGGGGGGSADNNAVISLSNTSGWIFKTIASGAACPVSLNWSSLEDGLQTGPGVLKITVNGTQKHLTSVEQGDVVIDVSEYLSAGSNTVKVNVTDVYGNSRTISLTITAVALSLASSFDNTVPYTGAFNFVYTPTGAASKKVYFLLDGEEIGTATVTASGRQQTQPIPAQAHGSHTLEVYFEATIDGETVDSNRLFYDVICLEEGNTTPIIASDYNAKTAEQFDSIVIPYRVYDPANMNVAIVLSAPDMADKPLTVDRTVQKWTYRADTAGAQALTITCGKTVKTFNLTVTASEIDVEAETDSLVLHLSSYGRSNNEDNPAQWKSGEVEAVFTGFNFTSNGWHQDNDGITALRVSGDARLTIPAQLFAKDFRTTGKTIELEFATRDILNYDAVILSCFSGNRGLQVTAQKALLKSEQSEISTQYKEDEHVRLAFVVQKRSEYRLLMVYINGILSGVVQYPDDDDFSQSAPVGISVGSGDCTVDLYNIRVYDNDLTRFQVLDNWIADTQIALTKNQRWQHNRVFDEYGQIVIAQLPQDLPYMILNAATLPQYKGHKVAVSGEYVDPVDNSRSFTFTGAEADVQGTSSSEYARKNYKIKFNGGFIQNGETRPNYQLRSDSVPTNVFTFKADVASSEGANNVELVRLYNDICPFKTPPQLADNTVRQGIDGYPMVIFQNDGTNVTFIGKYNFNNDKGTPEVFGMNADDESWEIRNNTSDRVVWKNNDFSGTDWLNDFEGRHPDGNTNPANLAALATWIKSTDQSAVSTEAEKAARLQKFKDELGDWMDVDSTLFYYLFTELFLMVDSRAKNAFPTRYDGGVWCWLPYDMDTAIGINNEGKLAFGYGLEDIDLTETGADVYNGQDSVVWVNVRQAFADELMEMYQKLRSDGVLSYADTEKRFEDHQSKWPAAIFNEDAYFKYLEPLFNDGNASYLGMLQGSKAEQRKWWLYNRFRYIDSKYNAGDALTDVITLRGYAKSDITVIPYADIYATIKYGSYLVQARALRGQSYTLECPLDNVNDTETYIYSASQLASIGDISGYKVGYADFTNGTKLQALKIGDSAAGYSNANLTELYLGNNVLLKSLDVRNCPNLGLGDKQQAVDISGCTNIEHVYFDGTSITGLTLPVGGILKTLHLPATVTNLTIRNQTAITDFVMPDYSGISTLRLENVSTAVPMADILAAIAENSRVRLVGFDWTFDTAADILSFYDRLDTMRGLDENGNNVDKAQVSGIVRVDAITGAELGQLQSRYPDVRVIYNSIVSYLYFYSEDGSTVLQILEIKNGADGVYTGTTPTKESTAQYTFSFAGWSLTPGGAVDADALKNITADRSVYAAYTATVRTYTVRFFNDTTLLQTVVNVPYGGTATFTGEDPVHEEADFEFIGFSPTGQNITGNTDCYAKFRYNGFWSVKMVERTMTGAYENNRVETIGSYAFSGNSTLASVSFENVVIVDRNAFADCALKSANFPKATQIGAFAFMRGAFAVLDLPVAQSIGNGAFQNNASLVALILRNPTLCTLGGSVVFNTTPIGSSSGAGYIYVPKALVAEYKAATNWSKLANKIRAIEDYPDITGG